MFNEKGLNVDVDFSRKIARKSTFFRKKIKLPKTNILFLHISSSYAKILGETNFCTLEIPRSGQKAKGGGEKRKKERERD